MSLLKEHRALLTECRALFRDYRALTTDYRSLLRHYCALLVGCRALLRDSLMVEHVVASFRYGLFSGISDSLVKTSDVGLFCGNIGLF